jgi:redox-sensitive bicupin YhaK (pirin superfamily)
MTSGRGIAHSEYKVDGAHSGHGLQLWIALPGTETEIAPHFEQHRELPVYEAPGVRAIVLIGSLGGLTSPATAYTPIVGSDVRIEPGAETAIPLDPDFEYAVMVIEGGLTVAGADVGAGPLLYLGAGRTELPLSSPTGAHFALIGGEPFGEDLVMWWNFVGRSHEDIVAARNDWENRNVERFADIVGHPREQRIPAPPLPGLHLKPRKRRIGPARN